MSSSDNDDILVPDLPPIEATGASAAMLAGLIALVAGGYRRRAIGAHDGRRSENNNEETP